MSEAVFERRIEKTPNGGDYSEIHYFDENTMPCSSQKAVKCIIYEKKNNGEIVYTTYGYCNNKK